jgi:RNA polymerase sigma-70 factor (ECF subfamily)
MFRASYPLVRAYALRRAAPDAAQDVVADTFLVAWRRLEDVPEDALPWLYGVATNLMLKRWRSERRRLRALAGLEAAAERHSSELEGAEERLDARSLRARLLDALAALPQGDRDVMVLVAWEELSYEEVGTALAIPVGTVRSRLNRARGRLRELLGGVGNEHVTIICEPQGEAR